MFPIRSFRSRLFLALLAVGLVPAVLVVGGGTLAFRQLVEASGTAGPWSQVAGTGQALLDAVEEGADPAELHAAAARHREALSGSVRLSRLYALVTERFLRVLPLVALAVGVFTAVLALAGARLLSGSFSRPIGELVAWTGLIARSEPLPAPRKVPEGVREFEQLREALRTMAHDLTEAREREIEGARMRSWTEMARRVAHEIKNPLTPMRMAAANVARADDPAAAEAGQVLLEEIQRLDELARTFSQMGRMPEGPPSDVDVLELLEGLAGAHAGDGAVVDVKARTEVPMVRARYDALVRAFRNLLVNALEATLEREARPARLDVEVEAEDGWVEVRIRDRGPGIPLDALERIWTPEYTTKRRGTGIGLPLVRQTVRAHGGAVTAANAPAGGAVFTVRLPAAGPGETLRDTPEGES